MTREPKSKEGCERQANAILQAYFRDFAGGGAFGWDWPTLRVNSPERHACLKELQALWRKLPSRKVAS